MKTTLFTIDQLGTTFELVNTRLESIPDRDLRWTYDTIYDAYGRPSNVKIEIWNDWRKIIEKADTVYQFYIESRNTFMFTINASFRIGKALFFAHITPSHNYLYLIG